MTKRSHTPPWTNVYGLARTLLAVSTLLTLLVNDPAVLWMPGSGIPEGPLCVSDPLVPTLFCLAPERLAFARWVAIAGLAVVASGWRPRFTGILHWWITHSFIASALLVDGGDHLSATLTLLMLPLTLTDPRRSHWDAPPAAAQQRRGRFVQGLGTSTLWVLRLQVAFVYLNAAAAKWGEPEWADGTALYYWLSDPAFGLTPALDRVFGPLLENAVTVSSMTWSVLVLEFALFAGLFAQSRTVRRVLLGLGIAFHTAIAFVHGLPSFVLIMFGALILLLRHEDEVFHRPAGPSWGKRMRNALRRAAGRPTDPRP